MAVDDNPITGVKMEIFPGSDISALSLKNGAVANIFGSSGALELKPCEIAEKLHPSDVWFKLDVSKNNFKEGLIEMGKLNHMGFSNFSILLSGLKDAKEIYGVRLLAAECGFSFGMQIPFGVLIEYPGTALSYNALSKAGASFAVIDLDSLSKRTMHTEKDHYEIPEPVLKLIEYSIDHFKEKKIHVSVSGNMLENAHVLNDLVKHGVDSLVANSSNLEKIKVKMNYAEKKHELDFLKTKMRIETIQRKI